MKLSNINLKTIKKFNQPYHWLFFAAIICLTLLFSGTVYAVSYNYWYQGRIFPGIFVGQIPVGGLSKTEAIERLTFAFDDYKQGGFNYQYSDTKIKITPTIISPSDPDINYELINWDIDETVAASYSVGRHGYWWQKVFLPLAYKIKPKVIIPNIILEKTKLTEILKENFSQYEQPSQNPTIEWQSGQVNLLPETTGKIFNYEKIMGDTQQLAALLDNQPIRMRLFLSQPDIYLNEINDSAIIFLQKLGEMQPNLVWRADRKVWQKKFTDYNNNLNWTKNADQKPAVVIKTDWLESELEIIKKSTDRPANDAKFEVKDGRVTSFQESRDGLILNINSNIELINQNFSNNIYNTELELDRDPAKIQTSDVNNLGITEIIGIGYSDFSGSPPNRVHNIGVGADSLNGLLIKPGEEFSLLKALLPINANKGYLPELVIKGNRTIPEYGGGLCQIGTTSFRAALASGLPITQRQNHSYRVSYYEPAGTDATIYDPAPDFRFLNDTPGNILIQTKIEDNQLIFEYWGTSDGRIATSTPPKIYNITSPGPTKYIETTDLEPGVIKCTERAHQGADAEFTYTVSHPGGEIKEKIFTSHYRPWQEVCLKGVEELPEKNIDENNDVPNG